MISEELKRLKSEKNLTTQRLSELSGQPVSTINRILSGQTEQPGFYVVCDLVKAMGGSLDEIAGIKPSAPAEPQVQIIHEDVKTVELYERALAHKNAWVRRLFIICGALVGFIVLALLIDVLCGNIGYIRY